MRGLSLLEKVPDRTWLNAKMLEATPSQTVYCEGSLRLRLYRSWETPAKGLVIVFPSLINRPYILDLGGGRSLIQHLVKSGLEVALFDWGSPQEAERDLGLQQLLEGRILRAMESLKGFANVADDLPRTLMGHCLGGNLALLFAAKNPNAINRLVCLTTPIDFNNDALLNTWFRAPMWNPERFAQCFETIPWPLLQLSFQMLRPSVTPRRWIDFARKFKNSDYRSSWLQLEIWSNDNISFSAQLFRDLLIPLYRDNALLKNWMGVASLSHPVYSLAASDDHIVPLASSSAIVNALPHAQHTFRHARGGHIGAVLARSTRLNLWNELTTFCAEKSFSTWNPEPSCQAQAQ